MDDTRTTPYIIATLLVVVVGAGVDLALDAPSSWLTAHVLLELAVMTTSLSLATYLLLEWRRTSRALAGTARSLQDREAELEQWRSSARGSINALSAAIDRQLRKWQLTPSEREVAIGLLRGESHKEVAARTDRSERTVRQHAIAVYAKSGLAGRAELAGFFLSGLSVGDDETT